MENTKEQLNNLRKCILRLDTWEPAVLSGIFYDYLHDRKLLEALTNPLFIHAVSYCATHPQDSFENLVQNIYNQFVAAGSPHKKAATLTGIALFLSGRKNSLVSLSPSKSPSSIPNRSLTPQNKRFVVLSFFAVAVVAAIFFIFIIRCNDNGAWTQSDLCRQYAGTIAMEGQTEECQLSISYKEENRLNIVVKYVYEPTKYESIAKIKNNRLSLHDGPSLEIEKTKKGKIKLVGQDKKHGCWSFVSQ
ncbi:MAG: hypothetical protein IJ986_05540 [Bacteroidales bacterium]|nr:hypothetical protein [Bacteroidales bacterium]